MKAGIAHLEFNAASFKQITTLADKIYGSNRKSQTHATVAAISKETYPGVLETGFHQNWPGEATQEVAALQQWRGGRGGRGRGGFRGGRGGRGGNRGSGNSRGGGQAQTPSTSGGSKEYSASNPRWTGPRHPDLPPFNSCKKHWDWGKSARFCQEPWSCPWKNFYSQPAKNNQQ